MKLTRLIRHILSSIDLIPQIVTTTNKLTSDQHDLKLTLGTILTNQIKKLPANVRLSEAEFKIFSQWGDDGIIQFLIHHLDIKNKSFVEFGVGDYSEANTKFLLLHNNWEGLIFDSSQDNINSVLESSWFWKHQLIAKTAFITSENINAALESAGFSGEIGLLHIDIDGNDYWIWKAIQVIQPVIVIVEYNSVFGIKKAITIPYKKDFNRTKAHHSNLYFGASLLALTDLAKSKGYVFIGCNSNGNNAYFIRKDRLKKLRILTPSDGYVESKFREGRNQLGELGYQNFQDRKKIIAGKTVVNTRKNVIEKL